MPVDIVTQAEIDCPRQEVSAFAADPSNATAWFARRGSSARLARRERLDENGSMAYDAELAERVRVILEARPGLTERKMFGGIAWMLQGNMACGVLGEEVIVRLGVEDSDRSLAKPDTRPFDMTGRPMRGFVVVGGQATAQDDELRRWVDAGADYASSLPAK